mmetsp:Transcript_38535/g.104379  ORF Transcript_38535/g.104379 Transcript_38535/m.104379 type:complete len:219 (-) Transcript_38535:326-982(-)|eukprot:CAMPEP_0171235154 /NCGR_PEP_ID=MMETSP0790-20130122/41800_1 /TAXON_ID=2925 /ORGANISM="Alexandrium catenella, Strain OF101" /LENGTH=218 /DNA_ID=CAMNT_0011701457 /DNA_START=113 /DNA_END=769 /DNA_ORIENTATION=+
MTAEVESKTGAAMEVDSKTGGVAPPVEHKEHQEQYPEQGHHGKGGHGNNAQLAAELAQKPYVAWVEDVVATTAACRADFDHKILLILDAMYSLGHIEAACWHLKEVLSKVSRTHVTHWRGYLFKLLRNFDDEAYHLVKAKIAADYAEHLPWIEEPTDHHHMRSAAPVFVPGSLSWIGEVKPYDFAKVAAHPLHAEAPAFDPGMPAWGFEALAEAKSEA